MAKSIKLLQQIQDNIDKKRYFLYISTIRIENRGQLINYQSKSIFGR